MKLLASLFFALTSGLLAQTAPKVTVQYVNEQACKNIESATGLPGDCAPYVTVQITDSNSNAQAFSVILNYIDAAGRALTQAQIVAARESNGYKTGAAGFSGVADITITTVQVTALEFAGTTTTVGAE